MGNEQKSQDQQGQQGQQQRAEQASPQQANQQQGDQQQGRQQAGPDGSQQREVDGLENKKPEELTPDELRLMADTMPGEGPGD